MAWPDLDSLRAEWDKLPPYKTVHYKLCPDCGSPMGRGIGKYGLGKHHCNEECPWVGWMGHTKCKGPNA